MWLVTSNDCVKVDKPTRSVESQSVEVFEIDGTRVVVEGWRREQDGYGSAEGGGREDPQEEAIQYHGDETPIVILL